MISKKSAAKILGISIPIIQSPMAGSQNSSLAIAVSKAGGLGSLPCALLNAEQIEEEIVTIRDQTDSPFNLNFFCHDEPDLVNTNIENWRDTLQPYYDEKNIERPKGAAVSGRQPFNSQKCEVVERLKPKIVSFHFGLPEEDLFQRVKSAGCITLCSATTVDEALWLESQGVDIVIAQGVEAGGHRGIFLTKKFEYQPGTMALVPQIVDHVSIPVVAAGGIGDNRGIAAAFALGATCVQMGSVFLFTKEANTNAFHLEGLMNAKDNNTALTNIFSGRPARGIMNRAMQEIGPMNSTAPAFPLAGADLSELKSNAESENKSDFTPLWSGQATSLGKKYLGMSASDLVRQLGEQLNL